MVRGWTRRPSMGLKSEIAPLIFKLTGPLASNVSMLEAIVGAEAIMFNDMVIEAADADNNILTAEDWKTEAGQNFKRLITFLPRFLNRRTEYWILLLHQ